MCWSCDDFSCRAKDKDRGWSNMVGCTGRVLTTCVFNELQILIPKPSTCGQNLKCFVVLKHTHLYKTALHCLCHSGSNTTTNPSSSADCLCVGCFLIIHAHAHPNEANVVQLLTLRFIAIQHHQNNHHHHAWTRIRLPYQHLHTHYLHQHFRCVVADSWSQLRLLHRPLPSS